jgi:hypothetical protein
LFSELPGLFGRDFAIGFFLPMTVFLPAALWVANRFNHPAVHRIVAALNAAANRQTLLGATVAVFLLWLGAVTLLALNRGIIRAKEGYGKWNPLRVLSPWQKSRFRNLTKQLQDLQDEYAKYGELTAAAASRRTWIARALAEQFPHEEAFVLPTAFGNTIRAFEVHSVVMYGLDAIPAWPRLLLVIPEDSRSLIDAAKAQMDFWLNLWFLSLLLIAEHVALVAITGESGNLWVLLALPFAFLVSYQARGAAAGWGEMVKAAFDTHLPELRKKLELPEGLNRDEDRQQWQSLSAALIFRYPPVLPERKIASPGDGTPSSSPTSKTS